MAKDIIGKIREFNRFYTGVIGVTNESILESPYSLSEVRALFEIYNTPAITARQIKEIMKIDEGYLSRLIAKLVRQKLVIKKKSTSDNRVSTLALSPKGELIFLKLNEKSSRAIAELIKDLDTKEQKKLTAHFEKIELLLTKKRSR